VEFKDIFLDLRKEKGICQNTLAKELDVSNAVISYWETGKSEPTMRGLMKIADYFDVTLDYLTGRKTNH